MRGKKREPVEEPDCCFNCRSFSPRHGRKGFGFCLKHSLARKPKDICDDHRRQFKTKGQYV